MTGTANPFGKILLYIDGSESSITAALFAIALSKAHGGVLRVIYVVNDNLLSELLSAKVFVQMEKMDYERAAVYRDERAVIGAFDWTLEPGRHWCLRGANGSGKSTLMALLYGDLWPAHGGRLHRRWQAAHDWKARVGLVSPDLQARYAATGCTVAQIVASGFHASIGLNEWPTAAELRRVRRELRAWGLDALAVRQARELSYGQLRLVLAARAFVRARRLYLLDEPFDGLDSGARDTLRARLDAAVAKGATLVMSTHHDEDRPAYVRNVLRLRRGRAPVVQSGSTAS